MYDLQSQNLGNVYRQEESEQGEQQGGDQGADQGEDRCHPSAYNKRLRATQSPNLTKAVIPEKFQLYL